jgi:hypothetical protein
LAVNHLAKSKKAPIAMIFVTIIIGVFPLMMTRLVARL